MIARHRPRATTTAYGSPTFAAHLAEREAALGLTPIAQELHKPIPQPGSTPGGASDPDVAPPMGAPCHSETVLSPAEDARRRWGIVATSAPRLDGAYTFTSRTWAAWLDGCYRVLASGIVDEMRRIEGAQRGDAA